MKRLFLVLLSTCFIASCSSPEDKAEDFFEDMMEALEEQDFDKVLNVFCEYDDWYNTLSESEQQEFDEALELWEEKNKHEAAKMQEMAVECSPEWLNTGQFMKLIRHTAGVMKTEDYYDYYYGTWSYKDQEVSALCFEGKYYVVLDHEWYDYLVVVPFENAEKAMRWLDGVYSRLTDIRKKMDASGVSDIEKNITIEEPDMLYCLKKIYRSTEVYRISDISHSEISIKRNRSFGTDHISISFEPRGSLTVSDESYHAMMAALKSRNEIKKQLDAYKELEDSIY
jgi:hypothetical protein